MTAARVIPFALLFSVPLTAFGQAPKKSDSVTAKADAKVNPDKVAADAGVVGGGFLCFALFGLVGLLSYFTPTFVGFFRGHSNIIPIFVVNFFLGWSLVGWVVALAWAFTAEDKPKYRRRYSEGD